jgi:hypothetical protein
MNSPGRPEKLLPMRLNLESAIGSYFPEGVLHRRSDRLHALNNLYRDGVTLELTEGTRGGYKKLALTETMRNFLSITNEVSDPYTSTLTR